MAFLVSTWYDLEESIDKHGFANQILQVTSMKRKTAKEILTASFQELAASKSIDKITIQQIVDNCGYSP